MKQHYLQFALIGILGILALGVAACSGPVSAAPSAQSTAVSTTPSAQSTTAAPSVPSTSAAPTTPSAPTTDIGVTGTGKVFAAPDTAIASVGVDITSTTLAAASSDVSTRMTAVIAKIKSMGVADKDIQTINYSVNPITSSQKEGQPPSITGYEVSNIVQVKIRKLDNVGPILDAAMAAGANIMNSLQFTIDDPTPFEKDARGMAVQDAMAKAKTLADAAGVKLGTITSLTENVSAPVPVFRSFAQAAPSAAGIGPVQSGQNEIDVTVELHYQIVQ